MSEFETSMFMCMLNNPKERVNEEYISDITKYAENPIPPCDKNQSLKLLKRFARKDFTVFWNDSVNEYLPAVSEEQ